MNPFNYQGPVDPARLIDRRGELGTLQRAAADGVAIWLAAPRRYGKTSLLDAHVASMRNVGHRAVRVDLSRVTTVADVAARFAAVYSTLPDDPRRSARRWSARLGISAALPGLRLELSPAHPDVGGDDARAALLELLNVPLALHDADGDLTIVCLDEFQDLLLADEALDGLLRSAIQHHAGAAAYVFAGSQPSLMRALFADHERPFYGQARPLRLPALPTAEAAHDIAAMMTADGLHPEDAVDELLVFTQGHPQRTLLLAHHLYNLLSDDAPRTDPTLDAIERALAETRDSHQAVWDGLGRAERIVLIALADKQAPTGSHTADEHRTPRSTLRDALERLLKDERHVQRDEHGTPHLLDPLLAEWLRRR